MKLPSSFLICVLLVAQHSVSADRMLFTGATVHTISGETFAPGRILVENGRITAVGREVPPGADRIIDLKGLHVYPGLIAPTTSLGLLEIAAIRATRDTTEVGDYTPDVRAWLAVNSDSELIPVARANGITHALPIPLGGVVTGLSGLVQLSGWTYEEMTVQSPVALHLFWPSMTLNTTPREQVRDKSNWKSLSDQNRERETKVREIDEFFQQARAYAKAREGENSTTPVIPAWEAMLPWVRGEIPIMVHANEYRQIKAAVQWAASREYNIIIAGGRDAWKAAELLATNRVPVIYEQLFMFSGADWTSYDAQFAAPAVLHKAGVKVSFSEGFDRFGASTARNIPYAAAHAVAFGLPKDEALKGITLYPAEILGVADRLGSIEAGKEATFFAADGEILDIRSNVKRLWIAGREVSLESRHTRLYEKFRARPGREP
jgi:imidazolonepropionase-like amidohydrolase